MPKVSVIVPIYGVEKYIERCARSLFEQSLDDMEFIFIDDCTPDNSITILYRIIEEYRLRFAENNWEVKIERMPTNSGLPAVRKHGIQLAKGDYIIHCDSDDWVSPNMYQMMYRKAIEEKADVVVCDYAVSDGNRILSTQIGCHSLGKEGFIRDLLFQRNSWSLCNKLFKRTACYKENIEYPTGAMGEDMGLAIQLLFNGESITYLPQTLYFYYYNVDSISHVVNVEKRLANFMQNRENTSIVVRCIERRGKTNDYKSEIFMLKWRAKKFLWDMPYDSKRRVLWVNTFGEINSQVLNCPYITIKEKIKFLFSYLGFYPKRY